MSLTAPRLPFDPDLVGPLAEFLEAWPQELSLDNLGSARALVEELYPRTAAEHVGARPFEVQDRMVPGIDGSPDVLISHYRPAETGGATPLLLFIHCGGLVLGNRFVEDIRLLDLAASVGAAVVSVEYRLAPEHRYPAALDDCEAAWNWVIGHVTELSIDPERIVLVGESAGGGIAAALAIRLLQKNGIRPAGQLLIAPMLDDRNYGASVDQMDGVGIWDRVSNRFGWDAYLGAARSDEAVPGTAAPARVETAVGLPPALIEVGDAEIFRDECVAFADRLWVSGVSTDLHVWSGGCHTFYALIPGAPIAAAAHAVRSDWLERVLRQP